MVGTLKRWLKKWLGLDVIESENLRLARAILALESRLEDTIRRAQSEDDQIREALNGSVKMLRGEFPNLDDHEARIAFCESQLTAKPSSPKIVPKAANWKQFRTAAEKASETEQEKANG